MLRAMLGLDDWIASLAQGRGLLVIAAVAVALGIRHAADPDHLAAVGALVAGLLYGAAGSAGVGILLLAAIGSGWVAVGGLALFAVCAAGSMAALSTGLVAVLASPRVQALMPTLAAVTLVFGAWYAASAAAS